MEFGYRAVDEPPPPPPPPPLLPYGNQTTTSSGYGCFTEQAIRAGYRIPGSGEAYEYFNLGSGEANECFNPGFGRVNDCFRRPLDVRETVHRELEKERIKVEIITGEIARRHELEAEVRREMMIERELALRARMRERHETGRIEMVPSQWGSIEPKIKEAMLFPADVHKKKDKIVRRVSM